MKKFISRPTIVEAVQFLYDDLPTIAALKDVEVRWDENKPYATFKTIHGDRAVARPGDWIVAERARGRYYPIKADIFEEKYKKYEEE